jgi:DNA-directed RNA polymerase III subunit RPC1
MRNPRADTLQKQGMLKKIAERARRNLLCCRCGEQNGLVKKVAPLKMVHEKYRGNARKDEAARMFYEKFEDAAKFNKVI